MVLPDVDDSKTGGSPIISYNLQWDSGTGTQFYTIYGEPTNSMTQAYVENRVSGGSAYQFRYRVKNIHGWSDYSSVLEAYPGVVPEAPFDIITENSGKSVKVSWSEPYNGGDNIFAYKVEIQHALEGFSEELVSCDGSKTAIVSLKYCVIPISSIIVSPWSLSEGNIIKVRVLAINRVGSSAYSTLNEEGAVVQGVPHKPITPPQRGSRTNTDQVEVIMEALSLENRGYAPATSYYLEWDQGNSTWAEVSGFTSESLVLTHLLTDGIVADTGYKFRYSVKNVFGLGSTSNETEI